MSKLSFRARALDTNKPMPIIRVEDVPGLPDFAAINRAVPQMPTGMEKEEECEHHLQRAISAQQAFGRSVDHVIPTPEVFYVEDDEYDALYPPTVKIPRQLIHVQLPSIEQDQPEYDMDTDDEEWLSKHLNISQTKFEEMIDCLEKSCGLKKVIELSEAKSLLKGDESVMISVYDYWLDKKLNFCRSLIPVVKTERDGTATNSSYVAFRRRTEKMQTRKNRKNDETSYEKMLKLKRDFTAVRDLMQMVTKRELMKLDLLKYVVNIFDTRYKLGDYNGQIYNELMAARIAKEQALVSSQAREKTRLPKNDDTVQTRRKRDYKKRPRNTLPQKSVNDSAEYFSSEGEATNDIIYQGVHAVEPEDNDDDPDGQFAFKRKKGCNYHAPLERRPLWPFESDDSVLPDKKFRFNLTSLSRPPNHCIGLARRRVGRGGRMIYDRIQSKYDSYLKDLSFDITETDNKANEIINEPDLLHFKPPSPSFIEDPHQEVFDFNSQTFYDEEELSNDPLLFNLNEGRLHKNNVYKYQESEICNFLERTNSVVCNSQHSFENSTSQPKSSFKSSFSKSKSLKSNFQITNLCDTNILDSFKTELNCNSNEIHLNTDNFDFKNMNFSEQVDSTDAFNNFLRSNNHDCLQTSKLEKKSRSSFENSNVINNGSDYLNTSDNAAFSHGLSTTILNESQSSSTNTIIDAKANISTQNSATISSNFSSHCKIKLSNSQNNLHPTDVT